MAAVIRCDFDQAKTAITPQIVSVYSRGAGLLYTGGASFLGNALKDACNAIGGN